MNGVLRRTLVIMVRLGSTALALAALAAGCGDGGSSDDAGRGPGVDAAGDRPDIGPVDTGPPIDAFLAPPSAACEVGPTPSSIVQAPTLLATLSDRWHEGWLASPAVADLDAALRSHSAGWR